MICYSVSAAADMEGVVQMKLLWMMSTDHTSALSLSIAQQRKLFCAHDAG